MAQDIKYIELEVAKKALEKLVVYELERKHRAQWKVYVKDKETFGCCTGCGNDVDLSKVPPPHYYYFCPYCGAEMTVKGVYKV